MSRALRAVTRLAINVSPSSATNVFRLRSRSVIAGAYANALKHSDVRPLLSASPRVVSQRHAPVSNMMATAKKNKKTELGKI